MGLLLSVVMVYRLESPGINLLPLPRQETERDDVSGHLDVRYAVAIHSARCPFNSQKSIHNLLPEYNSAIFMAF